MSAESSVIQCVNLTKRFGRVAAVQDVNLQVTRGQFAVLLGPSGCGKTTTLRLIAGFERPDAGAIRIADDLVADAHRYVPPEQRRVGVVFQDYALFPHLDVAGNVGFGLAPAKKVRAREERVHEVLALVGLDGFEHRHPHELSGGQQQRVALARALAPGPALILMDEPFSNLDATLRARVRAEVRDILVRVGATVLFVTHDQAEALSLADQVVVMWEGAVLQAGPPEEVYRAPATREVALFVGDANVLPGTLTSAGVETELGTLPPANNHAAPGPVDAMVRPELVSVSSDPEGACQVLAREFYGHDQQLLIRLPSGALMHTRLDALDLFHPGDRVRVQVTRPVPAFPRVP